MLKRFPKTLIEAVYYAILTNGSFPGLLVSHQSHTNKIVYCLNILKLAFATIYGIRKQLLFLQSYKDCQKDGSLSLSLSLSLSFFTS